MADTADKMRDVAGVYAAAMFDVARSRNQIAEVRDELDQLVALAADDPALTTILRSEAIDDDRRLEMLEKLFRGRITDTLLNTLLVANRKGRTGILWALAAEFARLQRVAANEVIVNVTSAAPLDDLQRTEVTALAAQLSGGRPLIDWRVEPALLGGLIVQIGDLRYDNSLRRHLEEVSDRLAERSESGLGVSAA